MVLAAGTKVSPYEIVAPLGAGGMGEVYRARDNRLGRDVAIKILPESFARDKDRLQRFQQEARAVAALNDPRILAVFDVGEHNGSPFIVSELLEGETLRAILDRGPLSQRKTIEYGVQIAQGLAAAHEKSIVHRDLKPENVFLTRDGRIKILDFGLAKLAQQASAATADSDGVTLTRLGSTPGLVLGTASYMAPEQVRGEPADSRSDIFALGSVLYEMLSGVRAFHRGTAAESMTAILREDPPELADSGPPVPPALDRIVRRCLEKSPEQRFQSARDLSFALGALSGSDASGAARIAEARRRGPLVAWLAAGSALAIAALIWIGTPRPAARSRMQFAIPVAGEVNHIALSRDGSMLAFTSPEESSGVPMLYVQPVGSAKATVLAGTEGAIYPFWSPDGSRIGFFAQGKLKKIAISGGPAQPLANVVAARGGTWGSRDVIIYAPDAGASLWRVNSDGTAAAALTEVIRAKDDATHRWPVFLPDGNHFLFWAGTFTNSPDDRLSGIYVSSLDKAERKLVVLCRSSFDYDSNNLFYMDEGGRLVSVTFDTSTARVSTETHIVTNVVGYKRQTYWAALTAASNGTLIYNPSTAVTLSRLTWMDRTGKILGRVGEPAEIANPSLSPDGSRIAVDVSDRDNVDIWLENTRQAGSARFTFDPTDEVTPVWSRDGSTLAYRETSTNTVLISKRGTGLEREKQIVTVEASHDLLPNSWSPDDRQILCTHQSPAGSKLELVPATGGSLTTFVASKGADTNGQISPDGKWAAYASNESGNWEVYVTTFPGAAGKWQVSRGGTEPRWRGDGKEMFYIAPSGMLMAVPVNTENTFSAGTPTPLFQVHGREQISSSDLFTYDVAKDGKRFLVNRYVKPEHNVPLTIVLNAAAEARK